MRHAGNRDDANPHPLDERSIEWFTLDPGFVALDELTDAFQSAYAKRGQPGFPKSVNVYVNVPFCTRRCSYCMYYSCTGVTPQRLTEYVTHVEGLVAEWTRRSGPIAVSNLYIGGGTPSLLSADLLERLLYALNARFRVRGEATLEANPASLSIEKIAIAARFGITRISLGVQSLDAEVLARIERNAPDRTQLLGLLAAMHESGIRSNLDLVLGLPGQSRDSFVSDIMQLASWRPDGINVYRYQAERQPGEGGSCERMSYSRVLSPLVLARLAAQGFFPGSTFAGNQRFSVPFFRLSARQGPFFLRNARAALMRLLGRDTHAAYYTNFDQSDAHVIGIGAGAYGHIHRVAWYRDVSAADTLRAGDPPALVATRVDGEREALIQLAGRVLNGERVHLGRLTARLHLPLSPALLKRIQAAKAAGALQGPPVRLKMAKRCEDALLAALFAWRGESAGTASLLTPPQGAQAPDMRLLPPELAFSTFRSLLEIPEAGQRWLGASVAEIGRRGLVLDLGESGRQPLVLGLEWDDGGDCYCRSARFKLTSMARPEGDPFSNAEIKIMEQIRALMQRRDRGWGA